MSATLLPEVALVKIREYAQQQPGRFVDPTVIVWCREVLTRRGEDWAASVLGRSLERRSLLSPSFPWLTAADPYALIEADRVETVAQLEAIGGAK